MESRERFVGRRRCIRSGQSVRYVASALAETVAVFLVCTDWPPWCFTLVPLPSTTGGLVLRRGTCRQAVSSVALNSYPWNPPRGVPALSDGQLPEGGK